MERQCYSAIAVVVAAVVGGPVTGMLSSGGFDDPKSESSRASAYLRDRMGTGNPDVVVLVTARSGRADDDHRAPRPVHRRGR